MDIERLARALMARERAQLEEAVKETRALAEETAALLDDLKKDQAS